MISMTSVMVFANYYNLFNIEINFDIWDIFSDTFIILQLVY